jgi:prophage regulatory protein
MSLIRIHTVKELTSLSKSSIYAMVAVGKFPRPIKIGARASAWVKSEVQDFIQERIRDSRPDRT